MLCFAETWFRRDASQKIDGYSAFITSREDRRGGGVAIYVREDINSIEVNEKQLCSRDCEQVWYSVVYGPMKILIGCMYRPPTQENLELVNKAIAESMETACALVTRGTVSNLVICGDFNHPEIGWGSVLIRPSAAAESFLDDIYITTISLRR